MNRAGLTALVRHGPLFGWLSWGLFRPAYRAAFLASASGLGLLELLAGQPSDAETVAARLGVPPDRVGVLRYWLDIGVRLRVLGRRGPRYRLRGRTSRALARTDRDPVAAALEEVVGLHVPLLYEAPRMLRDGRRLTLDDRDAAVITRATRLLHPFIEEIIAAVVPRTTPVRLLELGCGNGDLVCYAASLNPRLTALAIDLQPGVVAAAANTIAAAGLAGRVEVRRGDLRELMVGAEFDVVTLHNAVYYIPIGQRAKVLRRVRGYLRPGGRLVLTTSCRGGPISIDVLDLCLAASEFGGALPVEDELVAQLRDAGFEPVTRYRLMPGTQLRAFVATNPSVAGGTEETTARMHGRPFVATPSRPT